MRSIVSGIVGAIIAGWLCNWWLSKHPLDVSEEKKDVLVKKYKRNIYIAGVVMAAILILAWVLFTQDYIDRHNWRAGLILFGCMFASPFLTLNLPTKGGDNTFEEAMLAYAVKQNSPVGFLLFVMVIGVLLLFSGIIAVFA